LITFLSSPKAFAGRAATQQIAAIKSWLALSDDVEIILYGNSPGIIEACTELNISHVPNVESTNGGIPYFGAIADHAARYAKYDNQVYINCDILLTSHILTAFEQITFNEFLIIGQRIDLKDGVDMNLTEAGFALKLDTLLKDNLISLHPPAGSDYFGFKRGMWNRLPPVIIGRGGYDNALIAFCLQKGIPVIDTTLMIPAIHQFHEYGHAKGGYNEIFNSSDSAQNSVLLNGYIGLSLEDANWIMTSEGLKRKLLKRAFLRSLHVKLHFVYKNYFFAKLIGIMRRIFSHLNFYEDYKITLEEVLNNYKYKQ